MVINVLSASSTTITFPGFVISSSGASLSDKSLTTDMPELGVVGPVLDRATVEYSSLISNWFRVIEAITGCRRVFGSMRLKVNRLLSSRCSELGCAE